MDQIRKLNRIRLVNSLIGVFFCASAAALISYLFHGSEAGKILPFVFLGLVILVALRFGIAAGVAGSVVSVLIFAVFMYRPAGSLAVASVGARSNLAWLLLGGIVLSYLFAPERHRQ